MFISFWLCLFIINISIFNLCFDLFSVVAKKSQSNQQQCSLCCRSPCFLVLLRNHYGSLQCFSTYFRISKEIGVLRPMFPDYVISCDYVLTKIIPKYHVSGSAFLIISSILTFTGIHRSQTKKSIR